MEPVISQQPPYENNKVVSMVNITQDATIDLAMEIVRSIKKEQHLRTFEIEVAPNELAFPGYYIPNDPDEYATNVDIAFCIGQTNVTIAKWYNKFFKPYVPSWYMKDEKGNWRAVAIIEFTDYASACAKEIPLRDSRTGKPRVDENQSFIKIQNPLVKDFGWDEFYRGYMQDRWDEFKYAPPQSSALAVHRPDNVIEAELIVPQPMEDDAWLRQSPELQNQLKKIQKGMGERGELTLAKRIFNAKAEAYRKAGRLTEASLVGQFDAGRDDFKQQIEMTSDEDLPI